MNTKKNEKSICVSFNEESLLYLYNELPAKRMQMYKDHLMVCKKCSNNLKFNIELLELAKNDMEEGISTYEFDLMIKNAISKKANSFTKFVLINKFIDFIFQTTFRKIAFSVFAVIILLFFIITPKKELINSNTLIDTTRFKMTHIYSEDNNIKNKINFEDDKEWRKNILYVSQAIDRNIEINLQNNF